MEVTKVIARYPSNIASVALGDDGNIFAVATKDGIIYSDHNFDLNASLVTDMVRRGSNIVVSYIPNDTDVLRISNISLSSGEETEMLDIPTNGTTVNLGGKLAIDGARNMPLIALGDNGGGQQVPQSVETPWGKVIWTDGQIHSWGLTNPKSISALDNKLFVVDDGFAQQKIETLKEGSNYGWNIRKGQLTTFPISNISKPNLFSVPHYHVDNTVGIKFGGGSVVGSQFLLPQGNYITSIPISGSYWTKPVTISTMNKPIDLIYGSDFGPLAVAGQDLIQL